VTTCLQIDHDDELIVTVGCVLRSKQFTIDLQLDYDDEIPDILGAFT